MNEPSGESILATLVKLLAEQEGAKIKFDFKKGDTNEKRNFKSGNCSDANSIVSVCQCIRERTNNFRHRMSDFLVVDIAVFLG